MSVISTEKDVEALTLTFVAEFAAPVERVWQVWADPRQLERWWGPPTWPATFDRHEMAVGGGSDYYMTGPEGDKARGWLRCVAVEEPHHVEFDDGFANEDGSPTDGPVTRIAVTLEAATLDAGGAGTRMTTVNRFASLADLDKMVEMGMAEGMRLAMGQIDALLA